MYSVLSNKKNIKFVENPYPYLIIDDALPWDFYNELKQSFPSNEKIINKNKLQENFAYRYNAIETLNDDEIANVWKDFVNYHTSYNFLNDFYNQFNKSISKLYPASHGKLPNKNNTGIRFTGEHYFNLDCQFVINTPTNKPTSVIEPHLDNPKEFYAALLYMRDPEDDSIGGNLTTYSFKNNPIFHGKSRVREENVNLIDKIDYKENRLVMFLNSPLSIHGVSKRQPTDHYRKYINIIGEFNFELFDFRKYLEN